jgi:lysophospholipase L1-like esterase
MKHLIFCFFLSLCFNLSAQVDSGFVAGPNDSRIEHPQKPINYLALGDSYSVGVSVPANKAWPRLLANALTEKGLSINSTTIAAKAYWQTNQLLEGAPKIIGDKKFEMVSLMIGMSNAYQEQDTTLFKKEFIACLTYAIEHCSKGKEGVFVVSIPDYSHMFYVKNLQKKASKRINQYNAICKRVANNFQVPYYNITPISRQWKTNQRLLVQGRVFPSVTQYKLWVKQIECDVYRLFQPDGEVCKKIDSGYVAHQYYMEYEALKNAGNYEKALTALGQAFNYKPVKSMQYAPRRYKRSPYYQASPQYISNPKFPELQSLIQNEMSDSIKYENRIEFAQNALEASDDRGWTADERDLKMSYLNAANNYYQDAQKHLSKPTTLAAEIENRIESIPRDTVYIYDPIIQSMIFSKSQYKIPNRANYSLHQFTNGDTLFNKRDSSLFNGVFVRGPNIHLLKSQEYYNYPNYGIGAQTFSTIANGLMVDEVTHSYGYVSVYDSSQNLNPILYLSSIHKNNRSNFVYYNHLGDTIQYRYKTLDGYRLINLDNNGDTTFYQFETIKNDISIEESISYNLQGDTTHYFRTEKFPDSTVFMQIHFGENRDTLSYDFKVNAKLNGIQWKTNLHYLDYPTEDAYEGYRNIRITTNWKNDTLIDLINENIIYVNSKYEIISEEEYLSIVEGTSYYDFINEFIYVTEDFEHDQAIDYIYFTGARLRTNSRKDRKTINAVLNEYKKLNK